MSDPSPLRVLVGHRQPSLIEVARAVGEGWRAFLGAAEHGETEVLAGASLGIAGERSPDMNWAYVYGPDGVEYAVRRCAGRLRELGLPGMVGVLATASTAAAPVAAELGLVSREPMPLMCVRGADARRAETELDVQRVEDLPGVLTAGDVLADAYGVPVDWCQRMLGTGFRGLRDSDLFLVRVDECAVAVAGTSRLGATVGIYAVGTRVAHRRRGAASAAISAAIDYHVARGAHWCALLSGSVAEPLYTGLGFVAVDHADVWAVEAV